MLYYAGVFLVIAVIAYVVGTGGLAGAAAGISQILLFIVLAGLIITLAHQLFQRLQ